MDVAEVPATARRDWREMVGGALVPMDLRSERGPTGPSKVTTGEAGPIRVTEVFDRAGAAARTPESIRWSDPQVYQLVVQAQGETLAEQDGRTAALAPGDFAVSDSSRPFRCVHTESRLVCVNIPRDLLPLRQDEMARLTGVRFGGPHGVDAMVSTVVGQLPSALADAGAAERARLGTAVLELLTVALAARLEPTKLARDALTPVGSGRGVLLLRVQAYITDRLGDPRLSPGMVAAAHHISRRYLHRLFEPTGTSAAMWIRSQRLERCRRDLLDPGLSHRPAYAIGARWGFGDPAHFSRVFRLAYGIPPGEYRLAAGRAG